MLLHCCQCPHGHLTQAGCTPGTLAVLIHAWGHPHTARYPSATHPEKGDSGIKGWEAPKGGFGLANLGEHREHLRAYTQIDFSF